MTPYARWRQGGHQAIYRFINENKYGVSEFAAGYDRTRDEIINSLRKALCTSLREE